MIRILSALLAVFFVAAAHAATSKNVKFYVHPDVVAVTSLSSVKANLVKYVEDMNFILAKNTDHTLLFNSSTDVIVTSTQPHDNVPPAGGLPRYGWDLWVWIQKSSTSSSSGGAFAFSSNGAGVIAGMYFTRVWNPSTATGVNLEDYEYQLAALLGHYSEIFGAGVQVGEYWKLRTRTDNTAIAPITNLSLFASLFPLVPNPSDSYWGSHLDFATDPLTIIYLHSSRDEIRNYYRFSGLSATIIRENYRAASFHQPPIVSISDMPLHVLDSATCRPVVGADITVWRIQTGSPAQFVSGASQSPDGVLYWTWNPIPALALDQCRLVKISCPGYVSQSRYVTSLDLQSAAVIDLKTELVTEIFLKRVSKPSLSISAPDRTVTITHVVKGQSFDLQASEDLVNWTTIASYSPTSTADIVYTQPPFGGTDVRFYRTSEETSCPIP